MGPAIDLLRRDERPLELAIDVDAPIAVAVKNASTRKGVPTVWSCPAVTAVTATTAYR